jgi:hypothetical protein
MLWLRQSTASQEILLGRFVDSTDGNTEETALSIANTDIKLWKEGATTLADKNSGGATHISAGLYYAVLDATDTNTLGKLEVHVHVSGALAIKREYMVLSAMIYDSLVLGTDRFDANVTHINDVAASSVTTIAAVLGTTSAPTITSGRVNADVTHIATAAVSTSTAQLGVNVVNFGGSAGTFASGIPAVNATQISGDATAADNLENAFDDTAGANRWTGIIDQGTAQAATSTTLQLRSAAAFADSELVGCWAVITGGSAGVGQVRQITAYVSSTDTATVDAWTTTPTGTITYQIRPAAMVSADVRKLLGTAWLTPGTAGTPDVNVRLISGDSTAADNAEAFFDGTGYAGTNNVIPTVTTLTGHTAQTGDAYAIVNSGTHGNAAIKGFVDDIGVAGAGLTAIPWNAAWDAEVQSEVQDAIEVNHLDHLLAADYDPASKPGVATALLNELVESDAGVSRYTANALEQAPSGGGGGTDWTADEKTAIKTILGVPASGTTPDVPSAGALKVIDDLLDTELAALTTTVTKQVASRMTCTVASHFERPESGSTVYKIEVRYYDTAGALTAGSDVPTLTGVGATTGSLAANIGACVTLATGIHTFDYTVSSTHNIEPIYFTATAILPDLNPVMTRHVQVTNYASQASVDAVDDFLDTEIAAIKAKTDNLPTDPADASDIAASFTTVNTKLDTIDDFLDTEIGAIKTKTDFLPSATAGSAGGLLIAGSNAATTFVSLTSTGAFTISDGLIVTRSTANSPAISATGSGLGAGILVTGGNGALSAGIQATSNSSSIGWGILAIGTGNAGGAGILVSAPVSAGYGLKIDGGSTSGDAVRITATNGDGIQITGAGSGNYGMTMTGDVYGMNSTGGINGSVTLADASIKDATFDTSTIESGVPTASTPVRFLMWLARRFGVGGDTVPSRKTPTTITVEKADGTAWTTQTITTDGAGTDTLGRVA